MRPPKSPSPVILTENAEPFDSIEHCWFWFIAAYDARQNGARTIAGMSDIPRPCEPLDILKAFDTLYRNRILTLEHARVLAYYGRKGTPPNPSRPSHSRAFCLWIEAMRALEERLSRRGIITRTDSLHQRLQIHPQQEAQTCPPQ